MAEPRIRKRPLPRPAVTPPVDVQPPKLAEQHAALFKPAGAAPAKSLRPPVTKAVPDETAAEITGAIEGIVEYLAARDLAATGAAEATAAKLAAIESVMRQPTNPAPASTAAHAVKVTAYRSAAVVASIAVLALAVVAIVYLLTTAGAFR